MQPIIKMLVFQFTLSPVFNFAPIINISPSYFIITNIMVVFTNARVSYLLFFKNFFITSYLFFNDKVFIYYLGGKKTAHYPCDYT
ncbi:hypothetical protein DKL61_05520 [Gammaproteobacteria bacterium ESL0073]|nr:hypothetical protein DKL61_05520 [Gammaproteobacteria bacterium ESL0073]